MTTVMYDANGVTSAREFTHVEDAEIFSTVMEGHGFDTVIVK